MAHQNRGDRMPEKAKSKSSDKESVPRSRRIFKSNHDMRSHGKTRTNPVKLCNGWLPFVTRKLRISSQDLRYFFELHRWRQSNVRCIDLCNLHCSEVGGRKFFDQNTIAMTRQPLRKIFGAANLLDMANPAEIVQLSFVETVPGDSAVVTSQCFRHRSEFEAAPDR